MTEEEYCDFIDLQNCKIIMTMLFAMSCHKDPNMTRRKNIMAYLRLIIEDLEPKIEQMVDCDILHHGNNNEN